MGRDRLELVCSAEIISDGSAVHYAFDSLKVLRCIFMAAIPGFRQLSLCLRHISSRYLTTTCDRSHLCVVLIQERYHSGVVVEGDLVGFGKGI